jgi:hypothetical protein
MTAPDSEVGAADFYLGRPTPDAGATWLGSIDRLGDLAMMFDAGLFEPRDIVRGSTEADWQDTVEGALVDIVAGVIGPDGEPQATASFPEDAHDRLVGHGDEGFHVGWPWDHKTSQDTAWAYCYASASVYVYRRGILYATVHLNRAHGGYGTPAPFPIMGDR